MRINSLIAVTAALLFGGFCFASGTTRASEPAPPCKAPAALTDLEQTLPHTSALIAAGEPVKIIAIGSSSTAGSGASSPAASYPSRLAVELGRQFPRSKITMINRGINGQESGDILARLKTDVIDEKPDLVLWQVGTNSVLRDHAVSTVAAHIDEGVKQIKAIGADVVLVDPQFAPRVIAKAETDDMIKLISVSAKKHKIGVFHRYSVMKHWRETQGIPFETFVAPDGLHHNDWSYGCWAKLMSVSITQAVSKPTLSAHVGPAPTVVPASAKP
ncbi:MAG TPA: GDSL-type esterase/lipase family protein [Xanthobacteraceae bacterium]|nr:GDSL-type esterase/lipase family protein [Xanthobacteraceae bacterium]